MTHTTTCFRFLILLLCCYAGTSVMQARAAGGWLTTDWWVQCTASAENELPEGDCDDLQYAADDSGPHVTAASRLLADLEQMSVWLKGLGFKGLLKNPPNLLQVLGNKCPFSAIWLFFVQIRVIFR